MTARTSLILALIGTVTGVSLWGVYPHPALQGSAQTYGETFRPSVGKFPHNPPIARADRSRALSPVRPTALSPAARLWGRGQRTQGSWTWHGLNWKDLGRCESSLNPRAVSPSGRYEGLFQMNAAFWATYGGKPYAASPAKATVREQLVVAQRGYLARGSAPWPTCGRLLR